MNPGESALDVAAKRLENALHILEQRLSQRIKAAGDGDGLFDADRSRLAEDLDRSRARERELEDAGAQASVALGAAIAQIRSVLTAQEA